MKTLELIVIGITFSYLQHCHSIGNYREGEKEEVRHFLCFQRFQITCTYLGNL